jgi:methyltransferase (TIGR00027 family)
MSESDARAASRTAEMVLAFRARAHASWPSLCDDAWAARLATDEGYALADAYEAAFRHMALWIAVRTGFFDRCLDRLLGREGVDQLVVLGAGFDTRAARFARPGLTTFDVDHPASLQARHRRMAGVPGLDPLPSVRVACDFERDSMTRSLLDAGFDPSRPAAVLWEGVSYYLPEPTVRAALSEIRSWLVPGSELLMDHLRRRIVTGEADDATRRSRDILAEAGEPLRWGTDDVLPVLVGAGFGWARSASFEEACLALTGTWERERQFRFQGLVRARLVAPAEPV